jgi:hypothetical protein
MNKRDLYIKAGSGKNLTDYTCQELKDDLSTSQKVCVKNATFYQKPIDGVISLQEVNPSGAIVNTLPNPIGIYNSTTDRVFFLVQGNSSQILVLDNTFNTILRTTITGTAWETDFKMAADGNIYISKHGTNGVQAFQWINPSTLVISGFDLGGRISGMISIDDFLYITPGSGNNNGLKIIRYNVFTNAVFITNSIDTNTSLGNGNYNHMGYNGTDIISHIGSNSSSVSFYSISTNSTIASVNLIANDYRWSEYYNGNWYVYGIRFENNSRLLSKITVIDANTYNIVRTLNIPLCNAPLRYGDKLISAGSFNGSTLVFDLETERYYSLNYGGVPFIYDTNKLGILTANDADNFPSQAQNCGVFLNLQDII